ncbi:hypothetical protein B1H19_32890 [Streptomyces gilvosporeus]|uniref:Uncharacterized protein n=1 Tax=Streptomyces gilvosporeus TaxID=553510 RepID=A0A1V0TZH3_9ACTN|nr:hypothetical protein B1H19_32890 [Streptomyces gilvosporeus]
MLAREARTILAIAPTPAEVARLTRARLRTAVTQAGRQRRIEAETDRVLKVFRQTWLRQPALVEQAMGRQTLALLAQLEAACHACDDLAHDTEELFLQHRDGEIITSFPGLATLPGERILAEIGDDRSRLGRADDLKAPRNRTSNPGVRQESSCHAPPDQEQPAWPRPADTGRSPR